MWPAVVGQHLDAVSDIPSYLATAMGLLHVSAISRVGVEKSGVAMGDFQLAEDFVGGDAGDG